MTWAFNFVFMNQQYLVLQSTGSRFWMLLRHHLLFGLRKSEIQKTMPWCFRPNYGLAVTSIIDCFEVFREKPGDLLCHAATWSSYKHYNTVKYLISVTPQGTVSFVSKGYGGRVSDKLITEDCGYFCKLLR